MAESSFTIDEIQNSDAGPDSQNRYEICSRTGFKQRAGDIVEDGYQQLVRPDSADEMQEQVKGDLSLILLDHCEDKHTQQESKHLKHHTVNGEQNKKTKAKSKKQRPGN